MLSLHSSISDITFHQHSAVIQLVRLKTSAKFAPIYKPLQVTLMGTALGTGQGFFKEMLELHK